MRIRPHPTLVQHIADCLLGSLHAHHYGLANLRKAAQLSPTGTSIYCMWHHSLLMVLGPHRHSGIRLAALASLSGDGAIIATYLERIGIRAIRGSSARGSARAAKELFESLVDGWHIAIAIDGPRGPRRVAKSGPLEIARRHGVPIVPVAARATREHCFRGSWDRFRLPLPAAHVVVVYGDPIIFPNADPDQETLELRTKSLSTSIDALETKAVEIMNRRLGAGAVR